MQFKSLRKSPFLPVYLALFAASCGSAGDETVGQVEEVVRAAAGNAAVRVWDIKICRDDSTNAPLNAVGLVGGGTAPRAWFVAWKDGQLSSDVDIEYETSDPGITGYYKHFKEAQKGQAGCRNIKADAFRAASAGQPADGAAPAAPAAQSSQTDAPSHFD
jgi:hypothetical protein